MVADGEVEARVEPVRHVGRKLPDILNTHRFAGGSDVTRERGRVERHGRRHHAGRHRVVLGEHETEQAVATPVLNEVEGAGVRVNQVARGGQDQLEQPLQVALSG